MATSKSLERLLRIRRGEEEHIQSELDAAIAELQRLFTAHAMMRERGNHARTLAASSAHSGELIDRIAGLQEMTTTDRLQRMLVEIIDTAKKHADDKRQELLARRVARQQVETLVDARAAEAKAESNRKTQSALDDWHRTRRTPARRKSESTSSKSDILLTQ